MGFDRSRLAATPEGQTALPGLIQGSPVMVFRQKSAFARKASEGCRAEAHLGEGGRSRKPRPDRPAATPTRLSNINIENGPMQSSLAIAGMRDPARTF